ncbi:hypothetical protein [Xanthomonas graminis]|uniref:hypothetical protein n=1 Tax=Xanthomonas graminis TaxID=3390026 RepID=UPI001112F922|nr:hypothetical protein [Xanthomonas translucens]
MSEVTTSIRRDDYGNPKGADFAVKNDTWKWGGGAETDKGSVYVGNSHLQTQVDYNQGGISASLSATTTTGPLTFSGAVDSNGNMTGSGTAKIGDASLTVTPDMATLGFEHDVGTGKISGKLTTTNDWSLQFRDSSHNSWSYGFSSGYNSSSGWSFNASIFSTGL